MELNLQDGGKQPTLAILTTHDVHRPFRGDKENFIDLIQTGKEMGTFVYVITTKDLNLSARTIRSFIYNPDNKAWSQQKLPLPQVIYNRIPNRAQELLPEVQQKIQACLKHSKIRIFNPDFFNKWTLYQWLGKALLTEKYIPDTKKLTNILELSALLQKHSTVYLKPIRGKAGQGIMKVELKSSKTKLPYQLSIQSKKNSKVSFYSHLSQLWARLQQQIESNDYIIQQGISLANYNQRPFDLRLLMQKNQLGLWTLTGIGARVAGKLSITTHVPRGGSIDEPEKLLNAVFGAVMAKQILLRAKKSSIAIAKQIEKASGYQLGEMSMDLGIDTSGHIWFFEANSRPMKFDEPDIRQKSLERIIQYSHYLSKSRKKVGEPIVRADSRRYGALFEQ